MTASRCTDPYGRAIEKRATPARPHVIAEISYQLDRLVCSCGAVMTAAWSYDWASHRRAVGLTVKTVSQTIGKRVPAVG